VTVRELDTDQIKAFDVEYVDVDRWAAVQAQIDADFPDGDFSILDIGGGNGAFVDKVLAHYPRARGTVLDNSEHLLSRNRPNERKSLLLKSAEDLASVEGSYDLVSCNWVLHHLVDSSYGKTREHQLTALREMRRLLTPRGRISIFENNYAGFVHNNLPGRIIYAVTSSKILAGFARRMGANTAGVGVCFLSKDQWLVTLGRADLRVRAYAEPDKWRWPVKWYARLPLMLRGIVAGHYWITKSV
jgi:ubiquinone/menaquinone biosynthesis C-methylase UbiE